MKRIVFFLGTLILVTSSIGQSLKSKRLEIGYLDMPETIIPSYINTYTIKLSGAVNKSEALVAQVKDKISLYGLKYVEEADKSTLMIDLKLGEVKVKGKKEVSQTVKSSPDSKGTIYYWYDVTYNCPWQLSIYNYERTAFLLSDRRDYSDTVIQTTRSAMGGKVLAMSFSNADITKLCENAVASQIQNSISQKLNPKKATLNTVIYRAKGKKLKYDDLDEAYDQLEMVFDKDVELMLGSEQKSALISIIQIWEKAASEADLNSVSARINQEVLSGIKHNLAFGYAWVGQFDKAYQCIEEAKSLGLTIDKSFEGWLASYQSDYLTHDKTYNFEDILLGKWYIKGVRSKKGTDLTDKLSVCQKGQIYEFGKLRKLEVKPETEEEGCVANSVFWRVYTSKYTQSRVLVYDSDPESLNRDANGVFDFLTISQNRFKVKGNINLGSDTTSEAVITFERVKE